MRPLIVYVSGAPGSGKTTLAAKIAAELYIPHVSSDLIHGGVRFTHGSPNDRAKSLHEAFVPTLVDMARRGISFVVDQVLQKDMSERDIIDKLKPHAQIINIHAWCTNPIERHVSRELKREDLGRILNDIELLERSKYHQNNLTRTAEPLELGIPFLKVNTDDNYNPSFETVIQFIEEEYRRG